MNGLRAQNVDLEEMTEFVMHFGSIAFLKQYCDFVYLHFDCYSSGYDLRRRS